MPTAGLQSGGEQLSNVHLMKVDLSTAMVSGLCGQDLSGGRACQMPPCSSRSCWTGKLSTSVCCALQVQRADAQDALLQQEWGEILAAQGRSKEAATHLSVAAVLFTQQMAEAPHVLVVRV